GEFAACAQAHQTLSLACYRRQYSCLMAGGLCASLTFILPEEQTEQEGPVQPVEAKDLESQDVLSEVATEDEPQSFSSNQSNSGFNGVDTAQSQANKESNSRHVSNQCSAKKNSLKKWLERELAGEQKDYEQKESSILSNLVYS